MANALWITLIGMGLVFVAILLLWGLMALLVRVTAEREVPETEVEVEEVTSPDFEAEALASGAAGRERKRRAAAAAVAVAMALRKPGHSEGTAQPSGSVSAWQAVHRASQISQRVSSNRKKVVR